MNFTMFYAERIEDGRIVERGIFYSIAEFAPYRAKGWEGTRTTNVAADAYLAAPQASCTPELADFIDPSGALRKAGLLTVLK